QRLNAGLQVITHTDAVSVPGWSGAGYIIYDADTGGGAFKIAGGANGGWFTLLAVASTALLMLVVTPTGVLVSMPLIVALTSLIAITVSLALIFGIDFKTYEDEIAFIGFSGSITIVSSLIMVAEYLGASVLAKQAVAAAIALEIIFGIRTLGKK
ncbi:MAG: hypothetical protein PHR16_14795, partial [Methylovulum sp.]|nr:hypothetical protein [Methylovulum sp.]